MNEKLQEIQEKKELVFAVIVLTVSLVVSVVMIFQLLHKISGLEATIIEQTRILAEVQKVGG